MKPGVLAGAVALAVFLVVRRRKLEPPLLVGGALAALLAVLVGSGLVEMPNIETLIEDAGEALGKWTYLVVGIMAFLETGAFVGLLAPGETFMVFGGVVAGQGRIDLFALIAIVWAAAVAGDVTSFYVGRRLGRGFLVRHGPKVHITAERLQSVERFFDRHGGKAILIGRFVGIVRAVAPFLAGSSGMAFRRFLPYDILGAGLWGTAFLLLGYAFWQSFGSVVDYAERGAFYLGSVIVLVIAVVWAARRLRDDEERARAKGWADAQLDRPLLRPLGRVLRPLWRTSRGPRRFVWNRITPGDLGLEMTTLAAVAAVGSFAVIGNAVSLSGDERTTGDTQAMDVADEVRRDWLTDIAEVVTDLGALGVTATVVLLAAAVLVARRHVAPALTLVAGMTLTVILTRATKQWEGRPRPDDPLVEVSANSFPSGHTSYAVAWVAATIALTRVFPGIARATAFVTGAILVVVAVGATRVYLRAHWLSDVYAGAGLGAAVFALCAMVALVVTYLRKNPRSTG